MNCPKCGKPLTPGGAFCPSCGLPTPPVTGAPVQSATVAAFDDQAKRNRIILGIIFVLALIAAILTGLVLSGALKFGAKAPEQRALEAKGQMPGRVLESQGTAPPPVLPQTAQRAVMPQNIRDWLAHLRRCEELKRELTVQQGSQMTSMMTSFMAGISSVDMVRQLTDPDSDISKGPHSDEFGEMTRTMMIRWTDLSDQFRSYPPPTECQPLAAAFDGGLNGLAKNIDYLRSLVTGINVMQENAQEDIRGRQADAQRLLRTHDTEIGASFRQANQLLDDIYRRYDERPDFQIDEKGSVGGLLGGLG
jgi:hypothetical protein